MKMIKQYFAKKRAFKSRLKQANAIRSMHDAANHLPPEVLAAELPHLLAGRYDMTSDDLAGVARTIDMAAWRGMAT